MSRPYEFAEESTTKSPLDQRRPNPFPSGQPPSFKTNVNRAKTKRWVEAKSYSYDGDDWGDYDEVDEYGASQAAQNAIPAVPTGLRQQGQGLNPGQGQTRSFTNPEGPYEGHQGPPGPARKRSFDAGEEQRKFSTGSYPAPVPNQQGFPQLPQGANPPRHLGPGQPPLQLDTITSSPAAYGPADSRNSAKAESRSASLAHSVVSDAPSSVNPEHRRDFSPSAMVQPLRPSPSPSMPPSAVDSPGQARFPPRRSSVSKSQQDSPAPQAPGPFPAPQSEQGSSQAPPTHSSQQATSPSNPAKPLPFIRPSDIYKRMEEERAKERASMDSERPSIDSVGGRSGEDAASPAPSGKGPKERTSFESLGRSPGRRPSLGTVSETMKVEPRPRDRSESQNRRGTPALERVEERKSEYLPEYDANTLREQPTGIQISATIPPTSGTTSSNPDPYALPQWEQPQSNFSDEFWSNSGWKEGSPVDSRSAQSALPPNPQSDQPISNQAAKPLEHTPSLGFRSAVDTAFTAAEPQSAVDTDTDVSRSNTVSTSEISPITSKLPASLDTYHPTSKHPTIPEDGREEPQVLPLHQRHESLETPKAAQFTLPRKPSPVNTPSHSRHASAEFVPGYRRDLNTPSPNNSPARSPALAPQKELFKPSEAELDTTSPVEPQDVSKQPHRATDLDKPLPAPVPSILPLGSGPRSRSVSPVKDSQSSSRAGSPTKSRVRDLAVQYEKRGSVSSIDSWERPDSRPPSRPPSRPEPTQTQPEVQQASEETARPRVPGAWMSYTTNQSSSRTGSRDNLSSDPSAIDAVVREGPVEEHTTSTGGLSLSDDAYKFIQEEEKERKKIKLTEDPVSTLATAGSALGAGVVGALGLSKHSNNGDDEKPPSVPEKDTGSPKDVRNMSDQLTDEIERRLSSFDSHAESHYSPGQPAAVPTHLDPSAAGPAHDTNRDSSVLPSEYDSYWATGPSIESKPPEPHGLGVNVPSQEALPPAVPVKDEPAVSNPPLLKKRFSWEQSFDNVADLGLTPPPFSPDTDSKPTQTVSSAPSQPTMPQAQASGILQERTGETPVQIGASTPFDSLDSIQPTPKSAFIAPSDREPPSVEVSLPPGASQTPVHEREPLSPLSAMSGSHPSNLSASDTSLGKEAGDPSRTVSPMKSDDGLHLVSVQSNIEKDSDNDKEILPAPHGSTPHPSEKNADDIPTPTSVGGALPQPSANRDSAPAKAPPTFREILAIKSTPDRIQAYSNTREQFASTDTGIGSWLDETVATYPEHQSLASSVWQSQANQSGPMAGHTLPTPPGVERGHKSSPSLSRFGLGALTGGGSTSGQTPGPSFSASRRVSSNLASSSPTGGDGAGQSEGKGQQIGKDLLHSAGILGGKAGILGGKATTGAKGLLAKSKNRFKHGGDKTSSPRSSVAGDASYLGTPSTWSLHSGQSGQAPGHSPLANASPAPPALGNGTSIANPADQSNKLPQRLDPSPTSPAPQTPAPHAQSASSQLSHSQPSAPQQRPPSPPPFQYPPQPIPAAYHRVSTQPYTMPPPPLPTIPTESASSSQSNVLGSIRNRRRSSIQPSESGSRPQSQSRSLADSKEIKRRSGKWDIGNMFRRGRSTASSIISIGSRSSRPSSMALESTDAPQLPHIQGTQPLSQNFNLASQQPMPFPTTSGPPGPQQLHGPAIPQQQDTQAFGTAVQFQIPQWQQGSLMHHQPALDPTKQGPQVAYPNNHSGQPPQQSSSTSEAVPPSRRQSTMAMTVSGAAAPKVSDVALWDEPPKTPTGNPHTVAPFGGQGDHGFDTLMPPPKITEVEGIHQLGVLPSPARSTFKRESHGADMPTNDGDMSPSRMRDTTGDSASEAPDQEAGSLDNVRQKLLLESVVRHSQGYIFEGIDVEQLRKVQREADEEREQEKLEEDKKQQKLLNEITTDGSGTNVEAAVPIDGSDTVTPTGPSFPSKEAQAVSSSQPDGGPVEQIVVASASPMLEDDLVTPRATILYESQVQSAGGATKDDSPDRRRISRASTAASWEKDTSSDAISWPSIEKHRELQPSDNESTGAEDSDIEKTIEIEKTEQYQGSRHNEPAPTVGASSEPRSEQKWQEVKGSPSVFSKQVRTGAAGPSIPSEPTPTAAAGDAQIPRLDPAVNISGAGELDGSGMKPTPNVSTIHPDDDHPRDVSGSEPPVSPVRTSFMERDYHPPAPSRERPMSFVHLPRTGGVPQDVITVSPRHGLQAISDSVSEHSPPKHEPPKPSFTSPKRSSQHGPNLATSPPKQHQSPQGPQISTIPILTPPAGRDMGETIPPAGQAHGKPVQGRPNHGVNPPNLQLPAQRSPEDIRRQTFSPPTIDPRQHSSEYRLPGVGPPAPSKSEPLVQKSRFGGQLFKSKSALKTPPAAPPQPVTPQRINPELVSPPSNRQPSYQSTITSDDGQEEEAQKKLRKSGIINPFNNRPLSVDADSVLSKADSTQGQAGDSPTRTISQQIIGGIPPPVEKPKPTDAKSGKKLQRSSSSLGPDPPKKKRFSALGSFFGRSESKMTKKGGPAIIGPGPAYQDMRSYQSNPQRGQSSSSNRTMSLPHSMPPPILEDPGMPPPLGGYYAPPTWSPDQGLGRVDPTGQQQPVAERTQSLTSNTQQHLPYAGPAPIRNSPPVPPGYGPGAVPYGPQSVSSISPDSRASLGPRTPSGGPFFYNANGSPAQGGMPPMDPRQGPAPGNQRWSNAAMPPYIRMGSINETPGQHQERPWNISLPSSVEESEDEMSHNRRPSQEMIAARMAAMRYRRVSDQGHFPPQTYTPAQLAQLTQMQQHQQYQQYQQYQQQQVFIQQQRLMQQQQQQVQQRSYGQPPPAASYQQPPSPQSQASSQPPPPMSFQQTPSPPSQAPPQPQQILQRTQSLPQQPHGFVLPQQPAQHNLPRSLSHAHSSPHTTQPPHSSYSPQPPPAPQQYSSPPEPERTPPQPPSLNTNVKPHRIPLPMSPSTATSMSPINPLAISMSPPPPPPKDFPPGPPHVFQDPAKGNSAALSTTAGVSAAGAVAVGGAAAVTGASAADSQPLREDSEDDEPVMRGVSYPGMEWVPQWTED